MLLIYLSLAKATKKPKLFNQKTEEEFIADPVDEPTRRKMKKIKRKRMDNFGVKSDY